MFESDVDRFIRELREKQPQIAEQQLRNRATWWDRPQDLETQRERRAASVPQPAYVYFPLPKAAPGEAQDSGNKASNPSRPA